ncbi:hypothetical protein, partial [Proteus mirabilis]|uniref:hypothetical protein n=1 Tax=Proteus mirabilis TaxID=584 RepID=UPI00195455E7
MTVDAPATVKPKPRKPAVQTAGASRNSAKPIQRSVSVAATNEQGQGGARASLDQPAAVARYQLPQRSFSITAKEVDE